MSKLLHNFSLYLLTNYNTAAFEFNGFSHLTVYPVPTDSLNPKATVLGTRINRCKRRLDESAYAEKQMKFTDIRSSMKLLAIFSGFAVVIFAVELLSRFFKRLLDFLANILVLIGYSLVPSFLPDRFKLPKTYFGLKKAVQFVRNNRKFRVDFPTTFAYLSVLCSCYISAAVYFDGISAAAKKGYRKNNAAKTDGNLMHVALSTATLNRDRNQFLVQVIRMMSLGPNSPPNICYATSLSGNLPPLFYANKENRYKLSYRVYDEEKGLFIHCSHPMFSRDHYWESVSSCEGFNGHLGNNPKDDSHWPSVATYNEFPYDGVATLLDINGTQYLWIIGGRFWSKTDIAGTVNTCTCTIGGQG